jgi:sugar phosphate isomerase/epimerase
MQLGIFAKTFAGTAPGAVLLAARHAGYQTVQYNMACSGLSSLPLAISEETASAVHSAAMDASVAIAAVSATYNMIHPSLREREKGRQSFKAIAAAAPTMGTRVLTLCTGSRDPEDQWRYHPDNSSAAAWEELCKEFEFVLPIADEYDVLLGVEPELANVINSSERARELLDTFKCGRVKVILDAANLFEIADNAEQRYLIEHAVDLLGDSIVMVHAKDRLADGRFAAAGTGVLDYRYYLTVLHRSGFRGSLVTHGLVSAEAERVAAFLKNEMAAVRAGA